jgi:hypothetical protein
MERVRCARAMRGGIGQRIDDLHLLDDRAGPSVRDNERQCIVVFRANVNEMNVEPVDLGHKLRQSVQFRLAFAPIVVRGPIAREFLHRGELRALRFIRNRFPVRPPRRLYALTQFGQFHIGHIDAKWADCVTGGLTGCRRLRD